MKKALCLPLLAAALICLTGMGSKPGAPEDVTKNISISISDQDLRDLHRPLTVVFSADMVAPDAVSKEATDSAAMPFTLSPAVEGRGYWSSANSFTFEPTKGYAAGTRYYVVFKNGLKDLTGKPVHWYHSFAVRSNSLTNFRAGALDRATNKLEIFLVFEYPVTAAQVKEHLKVTDAASGEALALELPEEGKNNTWNIPVNLGKYRPALSVRLGTDGPNDAAPLGFKYEASATVRIPDPTKTADEQAKVTADDKSGPSDISIRYGYSYENEQGEILGSVYLSRSPADQDISEFIRVEPKTDYTLGGERLQFTSLTPGESLRVTLLPGLVDAMGRVLREERSYVLSVDNRNPRATFADAGSLLTPAHGGRISVTHTNVDKVVLTLRRVYDNNLPLLGFDFDLGGFDPARKVVVKEVKVSGSPNEVVRRSVDPAALAGGERGVYLLRLDGYVEEKNGSETYTYNASSTERLVIVSDIGLTARVFPSGVTVFAAGLSTGKPMAGTDVRVYSSSNQLLCQGTTDDNGLFVFNREKPWEEDLQPGVVTSLRDNDITFLPLRDASALALAGEGSRDYLNDGCEAFVYTPRGVFRPGEIVDLKAFVRDAGHAAPKPFPVLFAVTSSRGLEAARGSVELSEFGGADFRFELPHTAPTGVYTATVFVPGKEKQPLGTATFQVEDFVPPRLEVAVAPEKTVLIGNEAVGVELSGRYLFGAPGAGLSYELGWKITPTVFVPKGYDGWTFTDATKAFDAQTSLKYMTGSLDEEGKTRLDFKAPADWLPPSILKVLLIAGVQEDGGRWTTRTENLTYFPQPYMLGLKLPKGDMDPGSPVKVQAAALTPAETPADPGPLTVELFELRGYWSTVQRDGRTTYVWNERKERRARFETTVADGRGEFTITPPSYGSYLVRLMSADGKVSAAQRINVWGSYGTPPAEYGAGRLDQVELTFDKPGYLPGETAKISIKAPFAGTLLLGVERSRQLSSKVLPMKTPTVQVEIPVTEEMSPNVTVTAWVYRPVEKDEKNWFAHRAFGSGALRMSTEARTLKVQAGLPERAAPSQPVRIPFKVADASGAPVRGEFSVALIDEGILSLTTFATPDPKSFFMALRRAVGASFDAYDRLVRPEGRATAPLLPGGDGSADYQGSLGTQQVFLVSYLPKVVTAADGTAEAIFDLPEYSGKGRLMIVGASAKAFASQADPLRIARDVTVEVTAPRAVAPGDRFGIPLDVFSTPGAIAGQAQLSVKAEGPVSLSGDLTTSVTLGEGKPRKLIVTGVAGKEAGVAAVLVSVTVPGREDANFSRRVEMVVRPPFPRTSAVVSTLLKEGEEKEVGAPGAWLKGSFATALSLDATPVLSILPALEFLREYPYGCLEQTTSRTWPYLKLDTLQQALARDGSSKGIDANTRLALADAVRRICSMQTASGGFSMWPGGSQPRPWLSVNAAYILVEAKSRVQVSPQALDRALGYLVYLLGAPVQVFDSQAEAYSTKAYAAFVLTRAGKTPLSRLQTLSDHTAAMCPSGRIFLAAAKSLAAGNSKALEALTAKDLAGNSNADPWNVSLESPLRNTALELLAWSMVNPAHSHTLETAARLADQINGRRWFTTQEAGMASLAVGTFLEKTGADQRFVAAVQVNAAAPVSVDKRRVFGAADLPAQADGSPAKVLIRAEKGTAYCIYSVRGVPTEEPKRPADSTGLSVQREWKDPEGNVLDLSKPLVLKQGNRVIVTLTVAASAPTPDVVLSDLTPGGMEVENPRLESAGKDVPEDEAAAEETGTDGESEATSDSAVPTGSDIYLDLREDRVLVFFDRVQGTRTYSYSMRAVNKGTFTLPPTAVEGMYNPERNDIAPSGQLVIE